MALIFLLANDHPLMQACLYVGLCISQSVVVIIGVIRRRHDCGTAWWVLAVATALVSVANTLWYGYPVILGRHLPFPSVADGLFFASYTCFGVALVLLIRSRASRGERIGALIDSTIIMIAASVMAWIHVLGPTAALSVASLQERVVALAYPLFDLALLALAVRLLLTRGRRGLAFWFVAGFVALQLTADAVYSLSLLDGTFHYGKPASVGWLLAYTLIGAAALHPRMQTVTRTNRVSDPPEAPMTRLIIVGGSALVVPAASLIDGRAGGETLFMVSSAALFILATARMIVLVRELQCKESALEARERELRATVEQLNESEDDLAYQAHHDPLTGLANRAYFAKRLERSVNRPDTPVAVMVLDLDGFKTINDSLGHAAGDAILTAVAIRLVDGLRCSDVVARQGGDEFAVLAEGVDADGAVELADRLQAALTGPTLIEGRQIFCKASIGIAVGHGGEQAATDLLRDAEAAMYTAKRRGGQRCEVFTPDMQARTLDRLALESDLREVTVGTDLTLHYQPVVNLHDGEIVGFEALLRWNHPDRGLVPPCDFIPIAEETGAIVPIGRWVLEEACRQVKEWQDRYPRASPFSVNVNVSARQLADQSIVDDVARVLAASELEPQLLTVEITETMLMDDKEAVRECLVLLKQLGIRISVDDFGTGYSSLGHLHMFPVDELKIDRSFVASMGTEVDGCGVAAATIRLARSLHIDVVAEGVEREDQLVQLRRSACSRAQGFYFSKPLDPTAMASLLESAHPEQMPPTPPPIALVVDDDVAFRASTCRILADAGLLTLSAATGAEALAITAEAAVDVVVLDIGQRDGYGVCDELSRGSGSAVPVVSLSGSTTSAIDRARGLDSGANIFLTKPVHPKELVAAVRAALRSRETSLGGGSPRPKAPPPARHSPLGDSEPEQPGPRPSTTNSTEKAERDRPVSMMAVAK